MPIERAGSADGSQWETTDDATECGPGHRAKTVTAIKPFVPSSPAALPCFGRIDRSNFGVADQRRPGSLDSLARGRDNRIDDRCQVRATLTWNPVLNRIADTPEGAAHRRSNGRWARTPLVTVQADEMIGGALRDQLGRLARAQGGNDRFPS
jgi:hypothetical protein